MLILDKMKFINELGIWEILNFSVVIIGVITGYFYFFNKRKRIPRLNIHTYASHRVGNNYTSLINIEFRNFTGSSMVICYPYFKYKDLRRDPAGHRDSYSDETEIKFQSTDPSAGLSEVEVFLKHKDKTTTWVPVDPGHTDEEVQRALSKIRVGELYFTCIWVGEKPKVDRVRYPV